MRILYFWTQHPFMITACMMAGWAWGMFVCSVLHDHVVPVLAH